MAPTLAQEIGDSLSLFGARCVDLGFSTVICGGLGKDPSFQGREFSLITAKDDGSCAVASLHCRDDAPFMVGSSVVMEGDRLVIIGGGATCFSMGTFWETGVYSITAHHDLWRNTRLRSPRRDFAGVRFIESCKATGCAKRHSPPVEQPGAKATVVTVPRIRLGSRKGFDEILGDGKPVIIEGLALGDCVQNWTPDYLVKQVGGDKEVGFCKALRSAMMAVLMRRQYGAGGCARVPRRHPEDGLQLKEFSLC